MDDGNSFEGASLGTTFLLNGLLSALVVKGVLSVSEMDAIFDATLLTMRQAQANDFPENESVWDAARRHVEQVLEAQVNTNRCGNR